MKCLAAIVLALCAAGSLAAQRRDAAAGAAAPAAPGTLVDAGGYPFAASSRLSAATLDYSKRI